VGARYSARVQTGPGAHPASCAMGTGSFQGLNSGRGVTLTPHPLLVLWSRRSRAIPLLPLYVYVLYKASAPVQGCILPFLPIFCEYRTNMHVKTIDYFLILSNKVWHLLNISNYRLYSSLIVSGPDLLITEASRTHSVTHHSR